MIKSPFNFVPLADKIYIPDWADLISQDIPFSDGVSGYIDLKITAQTPIFIRNGHTREEKDSNSSNYQSFSKTNDGKYFIPSTSIKGEVRSILEIMSFSRMRVDHNARFAQREWENKNLYTIIKEQNQIMCGYLRWSSNDSCYYIYDCDKPYRIGMDQIDEYLNKTYGMGTPFRNHFSEESKDKFDIESPIVINKDLSFDPKTAIFKYYLVKDAELNGLQFSRKSNKNRKLVFDKKGTIKGNIVLSGQPGYCKWERPEELDPTAGKFFEFVFGKEIGNKYKLSETEFNNYKFIYSESKEWPRINKLLKSEQGVPVFFRLEKGQLKDFGLTYLYKLPYEKSPYTILKNKYDRILNEEKKDVDSYDLAQCILGYTDNRPKDKINNGEIAPLKGRVSFSNAFSDNAKQDMSVTLVLNSPKASYYPIYIKQEGRQGYLIRGYKTYNDGELSGWKRYVVRKDNGLMKPFNSNNPDELENPKIKTTIHPLKSGTTFKGKIHFHNLRPIELGALLSALTFHATEGCFHQLGQAKPYGYGKTSYAIKLHGKDISDNELFSPCYYMGLFEKEMGEDWIQSETIKNLITMAKNVVSGPEFEYMQLKVSKDGVSGRYNEFVQAKKDGEFLPTFTELRNGISIDSLIRYTTEEAIAEERRKQEERKTIEEARIRELEEFAQQGLSTFIGSVSGLSKLKEKLVEWKSKLNIQELNLTEDEVELIVQKLKIIYDGLQNKMKKKDLEQMGWNSLQGKVWKQLGEAIGNNTISVIYGMFSK